MSGLILTERSSEAEAELNARVGPDTLGLLIDALAVTLIGRCAELYFFGPDGVSIRTNEEVSAAAEMAFEKHDATKAVSGTIVPVLSIRQEETTTKAKSPALRVLEEALETHPGNERLLHARASAFRLAGDAEGAVVALEALLRSNAKFSRNPKTWHALGSALRDAGRFDDAVDAFEKGAFCEAHDREDDRRLNLPCLTSAAAEAARGGDAGNSAAKLLADARERAHAARANHLMHIASSMDPVMAEALRSAAERTGALGESGSGGAGGIAPNQEGGCSIS